MSGAYYNEHDPRAAAWLRELIKQGHIADGVVDERSILDVVPADLAAFSQCHFFAGIGVWSHALRAAGWSDDRHVWTGSCPCQPFSSAGKGLGFDDERHLWPAFFWLIQQCRPDVVFGEQVAGTDGETWLDLVSADLEVEDYTCGSAVTAACGFGAPHQRKRLYWVADALDCEQRQGGGPWGEGAPRHEAGTQPSGCSCTDLVAHAHPPGSSLCECKELPGPDGHEERRAAEQCSGALAAGSPGPLNGFWRSADWLWCRDERWRPVEPGLEPLADGVAGRVGLLRGYGNGLVSAQAQAFIESYREVTHA